MPNRCALKSQRGNENIERKKVSTSLWLAGPDISNKTREVIGGNSISGTINNSLRSFVGSMRNVFTQRSYLNCILIYKMENSYL